MKRQKIILLILLLVLFVVLVTACTTEGTSETTAVYTIKFMVNNYVYATRTVSAGEEISMPSDPYKYGYTFNGWYVDSEFSTAFSSSTTSCDIVLYASWVENVVESQTETDVNEDNDVIDEPVVTYTIFFDCNGGSAIDAIEVDAGDTFLLPEDPTKYGYIFIGWYIDSTLTTIFENCKLVEFA